MEEYREHIDQQLFERIEAYLLDTMNASERFQFEAAMVGDEQLRNEVDLQRKLVAAVQTAIFDDKTVQHIPAAENTVPIRKISLKWWYAAAAVLLVASATWYYQSISVTPGKLFTGYFHADPGLPVAMSSTSEYGFYDGMVSYKEGDYNKAIEIWTGLKEKGLLTDTLQYYIGVASLNKNDFEGAVQHLLPVAENKAGEWQQKAAWYLALAYVKTNNITEAMKWLQQLEDDSQAQLLIKALQKLSS
ncbi:hypothetical protein [Agriterribacter sp.]|uniref:hypothetical protein n=1 Tax=Agriterribacter sp. TaxID=2821509 RepID=UPI002C6FC55B|nr:hypothetical protein [Agriterribacter sp.]HRO44768.1 hypothetical protein [Agriterribacter sp.]HRQ19194.1 hypothetical protein [Agriterribacter sp.]